MARRLVFLHGRAQEGKEAGALKSEWIKAFKDGLAKSGLSLPIAETDIKFPYYGQTLYDIVSGKPKEQVARIIIRGPAVSSEERDFMLAVLREVCAVKGVPQEEIDAVAEEAVISRGILNWELVQRMLQAIDRCLPGGSAASIAIATNDVYQYLRNPNVSGDIHSGVREAFASDTPTVVVSHSLGTVVAYRMLREIGPAASWKVPLLVTLGSPLAVTEIRRRVAPIGHPACVGKWFNAMDERDVVSLYPLNSRHFDIDPAIENKTDVDNFTDNRHGIAGYLADAEVAKRVHAALVGA